MKEMKWECVYGQRETERVVKEWVSLDTGFGEKLHPMEGQMRAHTRNVLKLEMEIYNTYT